MNCKPEITEIHPDRKGVHIVKKRLADGSVKRYLYKFRGGPQIAIVDEDDDAELAIRDHIYQKRRSVVRILIAGCRKRATSRGLEFSITEEWLQDRLHAALDHCEVTNLPFDYRPEKIEAFFKNPNKPSLDRINNSKGYTPANVRVVLHSVNIAMNEWGLDYYLKVAMAAVANSAKFAALQAKETQHADD